MMPKGKSGATAKPAISPPERYPSGDPKPVERSGKAPTLVKRIMDHAEMMGLDKRVATVLGRLKLEGVLAESEMEAGLRYGEIVGQFERIKGGYPRRTAKSPSYDDGFNGAGGLDLDALRRTDPETADKLEKKIKDRIKRITKKFEKCQAVMPGACDGGRNIVSTIVEEVCCNDQPVHSQYHPILKNVLRRMAETVFLLNIEPDEPKKPKKIKKGDAVHLAEGACDALAKQFEDDKATIQSFDIGSGKHKTRRLELMGLAADGTTPVTKAVEVKMKGLLPAVLDAQILKSAIARGWSEAPRRKSFEPKPQLRKPTLHLNGDRA